MSDDERVEQLERDVAFLAQMIVLKPRGHATVAEQERLQEIRERYPRSGPLR